MKRVCFFGIFDPAYARNAVLRSGFEKNGWTVDTIRVDPRVRRGFSKFWGLFKLGMSKRREPYDLILVCFPGHSVVWLARLIFGNRIVFDVFVSLYDSNVDDRAVHKPRSLSARFDSFLDRFSCRLAKFVLLETDAHRAYFAERIGVPLVKTARVFVGANDMFEPKPQTPHDRFTVQFHGTFIPLQGVPYIVEAAERLVDVPIRFVLFGSGQTFAKAQRLADEKGLRTIEFRGSVPLSEIARGMQEADVVLGIFGVTEKTQRVIPNKVYEAMASGKAIVTADSPAIRELPGAPEALSLVPAGNSAALALAIRRLYESPEKRVALEKRAREVFVAQCSPDKLVADMLGKLPDSVFRKGIRV